MSSQIPMDFSLELQLSPQAVPADYSGCVTDGTERLFKDILADENLLSKVMDRLKELLPEEVYSQIKEMVESGNGLPLAAIFSLESSIVNQGVNRLQDGFKSDTAQIPAFVASVLKVSENQKNPDAKTTDKALDNLGRNISEAISQITTKGDGIGKQIQELLMAAKAEFSISESGSKFILSTTSGVESSVTQSTALGTAISGLIHTPNIQANGTSPTPPPITTAMGGEAWGQAMGERIMWMVGKGLHAASIRINPPHLGPVHVQLSVQNDQANVHMVVQNGAVKEALDAAMPRLREMLNESNLQLVNVDVSHRESHDQSSRSAMFSQDQREQMDLFIQDQELTTQVEDDEPRYYINTALIDYYA